jgi:hypothetical protein
VLTVAAIWVAAGLAAALATVLLDGIDRKSAVLGEGSGTVAVEPALVQPQVPGATLSPLTPAPSTSSTPAPSTPSTSDASNVPSAVAEEPAGEVPNDGSSGQLGVRVGSVGGLYPGHRVELEVTYVNPYSFPIAIDTVDVTATGTSRCTARHLTSTSTPGLRLPAAASVASAIEVGMRKSAPDACQGVRFAVRVHVTAVQL